MSSLLVNEASKYYKEISHSELESDAYADLIEEMLPQAYVPNEYIYTIYQYVRKFQNHLWEYFRIVDKYYKNNIFTYDLYKIDENNIQYTEYFNSNKINILRFSPDELCWKILEVCNNKVIPKDELYNIFSEDKSTIDYSIDALNKQGLLYFSPIHNECVSIINPYKIL